MDCSTIELLLSDYQDSALSDSERKTVAAHLDGCPHCSALLTEMRSAIALCQAYPILEMDPGLVETILLRTSGRPRTLSLRERVMQWLAVPLLNPRFAAGATLATLFLALVSGVALPRVSAAWSSISPDGTLRFLDRSFQRLYGEGLRAYDKKNELQAQFSYFRTKTVNKVRFLMEQLDAPVQGRKKSEESAPQKEGSPRENTSGIWRPKDSAVPSLL